MDIATLIAASWSAGVNAYLTVLLLGVSGRLGWAETPEALQQMWVLIAAGALFAVEFAVDKVPLLDSAWDALHTVIRPVIGAAIGVAIADPGANQLIAMLLGGGLAFTGHAAKASTRLAINSSPEPVTNSLASLGEDGVVAAIVVLSMTYPRVAALSAIVAMICFGLLAFVLLRLARGGLGALRRLATTSPPGP
ncbi:MAG: DUF4126 domain-containing protein [Actinomycetota bacterium]|nr:DUF4126 domain-containing protein [Actinomycetota bacterium]